MSVKVSKDMKLNTTDIKQRNDVVPAFSNYTSGGVASLAELGRDQLAVAKADLFTRSRQSLPAPEQLLRLALNEAEALAWQTAYPHLVFPVLATEKLQALAAWNATQQTVRRASPIFALAE